MLSALSAQDFLSQSGHTESQDSFLTYPAFYKLMDSTSTGNDKSVLTILCINLH